MLASIFKTNQMKIKLFTTAFLVLAGIGLKAQLTGVLTVPGTYTSIGAAIADLNLQGVGVGGATVDIAAGTTETAPAGGYTLTATGTAGNPIVFEKSGIGANPLITAYAGGTATPGFLVQDGVWRLIGSDYITIDGIDITDPNVSNPSTMEFGYGLFKASVADGCQNNTIKNCVIALNRINNATGTAPATDGSRGIDVVNALASAHNAVVTVTAATGSNSNNTISLNTIQNCNIGIAIIGFAATTPFALADVNNSVTGNTIINYGGAVGATNPAAAIRTLAQYNINVSNNIINSNNGAGAGHPTTLRGIYLNTATSANASVLNNTVTVHSAGTTSQLIGIENASGSTAASNTINISNNMISNCTYSSTTSGAFFGIYNNATTPAYLTVSNNAVSGLTLNAANSTGSVNAIYILGTIGSALSITSNTVQNLTGLKTSGNIYCIYDNNATNNFTVQGNYVDNIARGPALAGTMYGFYNFGAITGGTSLFTNNKFTNMNGGSGASTLYGIYHATDITQLSTVSNNTVMNVTNGNAPTHGIYFGYSAAGSVISNNLISNISSGGNINGINIATGTPQGLTVRNNTVSTLSTNGAFTSVGISHASGINSSIYKNKVYDITVNNATGSVLGIQVSGLTTGITIHNNYIGDLKAPLTNNPANSIIGLVLTSTSANTSYNIFYNTIYISATSSGTNFGTTGFSHNSSATATSGQLFLKNNIIINTSTPNGTGIVAAFRRSTNAMNNFNTASNNNNFFAGIPSANTLIYYDGTNILQTLAAYQATVTPRDANSITESTPFLSLSGPSSNFLHVDPAGPSLTESGAINIGGIVDDYDNDIRAGNPGYIGTGINPDIGADEYEQILASCSTVGSGTAATTSYTRCAGQSVTMNVAGVTTGSGITYQWQVATSMAGPYSNVVGGSGATTPTYSTAALSTGTYYYALVTTCTLTSNSAISNTITATVSPVPTASASSNSPLCSGQTLNLTGGTDVGTNFMWSGPATFTVQNPSVVASSSLSGTYTLIVSTPNCTATPVSVSVSITTTPSNLTVTPTSATMCASSSQTIIASGGGIDKTFAFGTQANQNTASTTAAGYPAPYSAFYGGQRMQMLVLASELTASGFVANSPIMSVQFPVVSRGANWGVSINANQNFQVSVGTTTLTNIIAFQSGLTNVLAPMSFTPMVGYNNTHSFTTPFIWDGISNLVLETTWSNNFTGNNPDVIIQYNSPTSFSSTVVYRVDNLTAAAMATVTTVSYVYQARPDFKLNGMGPGLYSWSPSSSLSSSTSATTVATPTTSTNYTLTVMNGVCTSSAMVSLTVSPLPSVTVAATPTAICTGSSASLTASGASTYSWSTGATTTSINVTPTVNTTYTVDGTNSCGTDTKTISLTVNSLPIINASSTSSVLCTGSSVTLTASGANTYSWTSVGAGASVVVSPTTTTTYTVEGTDSNGCSDTINIVQTVSPCTGINGLVNAASVSVYPNPSSSSITLIVDVISKATHFEVYDAIGKKVIGRDIIMNETQINLSELAIGIYSYRLVDSNGIVSQGKLIRN